MQHLLAAHTNEEFIHFNVAVMRFKVSDIPAHLHGSPPLSLHVNVSLIISVSSAVCECVNEGPDEQVSPCLASRMNVYVKH